METFGLTRDLVGESVDFSYYFKLRQYPEVWIRPHVEKSPLPPEQELRERLHAATFSTKPG